MGGCKNRERVSWEIMEGETERRKQRGEGGALMNNPSATIKSKAALGHY